MLNFFRLVLKKLINLLYERYGNKSIEFIINLSNGIIVKGKNMSLIIRNDQKVTLSPVFKDKFGNIATSLGSIPSWSASNVEVATVVASADGMSAVVTPTGVIGDVTINMVVDSDPDAGVTEIIGQQAITFKSGKATFVSLSATVADVDVATPVVSAAPISPFAPVATVKPEFTTEPTATPAPTVEPEAV